MIEIRSDGDTEESGGIKTRRVYHYRVGPQTAIVHLRSSTVIAISAGGVSQLMIDYPNNYGYFKTNL